MPKLETELSFTCTINGERRELPDKVTRAVQRLWETLGKPNNITIDRRPRLGDAVVIGAYTKIFVNGQRQTEGRLESAGVSYYTIRLIKNFLKSHD